MELKTALGVVSIAPRQRRENKTVVCQAGSAAYALIPCSDEMSSFDLDIAVAPKSDDAMLFPIYGLERATETRTGQLSSKSP